MKTKILKCIIFSWIILFILSCEKDKDFPKTYVFDSFYPGEIIGYTNVGKITDKLKINDFINGYSKYFWQSGYESSASQIEIEIISASKARISDADTSIYYDLIQKNGVLYFQSADTMVNYGSLTNDRLKYFPLYLNTTIVPTGSNFNNQVSVYVPCYYMFELNGELHFPFVSYLQTTYRKTGEFLSSQGIGNYNNVFNTNYLNQLKNNVNLIDTIIYQNNKIILKEK